MGLFRNAVSLFRGKAGKDRRTVAAESPTEQAETAGLPTEQAETAGLQEEQAETVEAQPPAARREVKREARPDPNKAGWGKTID